MGAVLKRAVSKDGIRLGRTRKGWSLLPDLDGLLGVHVEVHRPHPVCREARGLFRVPSSSQRVCPDECDSCRARTTEEWRPASCTSLASGTVANSDVVYVCWVW